MTDQPDGQPADNFDELWREAIENHVTAMSDTDFSAMISRARPQALTQPQNHLAGINGYSDPADRQRALLKSIQDKQQRLKPKREDVNANGYTTGPVNAAPPAKDYIGKLQPGAYPNQQTRRTETDGI
jgi:hypothetical protein